MNSETSEMSSEASDTGPIFVRGMSRSGGTLMVTLLDAHPDVAMSYELYPFLLETPEDYDLKSLAKRLAQSTDKREIDKGMESPSFIAFVKNRLLGGLPPSQSAPSPGFVTFVKRCLRGGLSTNDFGRLLMALINEGHTLADINGRMRLIELCALEKMKRVGKVRWGMKCGNAFDDYLSVWPQACFLNMLRDGRDVLASQLNTGSFKQSPKEVANGWKQTIRRFEKLMERPDARARMVRYEALTENPEPELRSICEFLDLAFDPAMLQHQKLDLTIFKANHLSKRRVSRAIDTTMIGRWRRDLNPEQLADFVSVAGEDLTRHGYA